MANHNDKNKKQREPHQKKQVQPIKSMRDQPETKYGEIKKNASFSLTPTAADLLKKYSKGLGISTSELLERIARGEIQVDLNSTDCPELDLEIADFSSDQNQ